MAVIGGILMVAALAVGGFCLWAGAQQATMATQVEMFNNVISITPVTMFVLGAVSMLLLLLGVWMAFFATKRRYRSHRERRMLEKREKEQAAELAETRAKLAQREGAAGTANTAGTAGTAAPAHTTPPAHTTGTSGNTGTAGTGTHRPAAGTSSSATQPRRDDAPAPGPREDGTFDSGNRPR